MLLSEAYAKAEQLRGEGDAEAMRIYAATFGQDPEFYQFVRTLESYGKFVDEKTTIVFPADSELLRYLNNAQASPMPMASRPAGPAATATTNQPSAEGR